ncbi:MAG: hypothetical protein JKY43_07020 [Phycisphaerales bacterium]|nr:hypothetical protein [Phycisphaerales bacterium]
MAGTILQWIKSNILIVISSALILILLPVGWFFSSGWNNSIETAATDAFNKEKNNLKKASSIEYSLPAVLKGEEGLTESRAPNSIVTKFYQERKDERDIQVDEVVERGTQFNKENHKVLVEGLLPEAESLSELRKRGFRLGELIAGTQEAPSIYTRLLRKLNAGDAPNPETLLASLKQFKEQQEENYAATSSDGKVSIEQAALLDQALIKRRLDEYAGRAESIAFYCSIDAIQTSSPEAGYSHVPATPPGYDSINETVVYTWTWDYWIISDILRGISAANTDASGVSLPVPDAPVKHVEKIRVKEFTAAAQTPDDDFSDNSRSGRRGSRGGPSTPDPTNSTVTKSYTGRTGGDMGSLYDIRYVDLTIIASSKDLPAVFDALGKTNYMTVIDADLSQVNVWDALANGYFYGDDHLVRAELTIETVWLRSWTKDLMPKSIRTSLRIVLDSDNPDEYDG